VSSLLPSDPVLLLDQAAVNQIEGDGSKYRFVSAALDHMNDGQGGLFDIVVGSFTLSAHGGLYDVYTLYAATWAVQLYGLMQLYADDLIRVYDYDV